jgi:transcriptional regulator with GAF, ATPase, and Fis domain
MAKIVALAGPVRATVFTLNDGETSLGRDSASTILLEDISVSRQHCSIGCGNGQYKLRDLDSHNGTFINDLPVKERLLEHGDRIKVGNSLFLVLLRDEAPLSESNTVMIDDSAVVTKYPIDFCVEDALFPMARDLSALMMVSMAISLAGDLNEVQREVLTQILDVIPAQRGAIILVQSDAPDQLLSFGLERNTESGVIVRVSRGVVEQVLSQGVAFLSNDAPADDSRVDDQMSNDNKVQAVMCVPLILRRSTLGAVYLDTSDSAIRFNREHLRLLSTFANIAAAGLENFRRIASLEDENQRLRQHIDIEHNMIGESARMKQVYQFIARVAPADSTVLITGESGTGKELAAHAIHSNSPRSKAPFIAVNCATLTESLLESELFGHERGAFTGAIAQHKGKLEVANGGTVFLDEVGEMNVSIQARLLRVLQEREFTRIGSTRLISVDIRIIAATNRDLRKAIKEGTFREDLYFRLNVVSLSMPPLRDRREDIALLTIYFLKKFSQKCKRRVTGISSQARDQFFTYDWPGNVRELENAIERAVVMGSTDEVLLEDLPESILEGRQSAPEISITNYHEAVNNAKEQIISRAIEQSGGSYTEAAKLLGIHPNNLHRLTRNMKLRIEP